MIRLRTQVRPPERRSVTGAFLTLLCIIMGHALMETARDALFLAELPPTRLPWVYLGVALIAMGIFGAQSRLRHDNPRILGISLLASAALTFLFWGLVGRSQPWILYALYIWSGVFSTLVVIRFWTLVSDVFTATQAKRLFAVIGAGSVTGSIAGTAFAWMIAAWSDAQHMLLAASGIFALAGIAPLLFFRRPEDSDPDPLDTELPEQNIAWTERLGMVLRRPYLKRLVVLSLVSTTAVTIVDYVFKSSVATAKSPDELGTFFSTTYLVLNLLSLLVQLTAVGWLTRSRGLHEMLGILPVFLLVTSLGMILAGLLVPGWVFALAVGLKGFDGSMRHSVHRTATEMLYVPLTRDVRNQVKGFIDIVGQRGGQALASLGLLALAAFHPRHDVFLIVLVALAALWMALARGVREPYLDLFRRTLSEAHFETRIEFPALDLASLESLMRALNSTNDLEVQAALDLLAQQDRVHLIQPYILYHPSSGVVIKALEVFTQARRKDFLPITERLKQHEDPAVRAATLRATSTLAPDVASELNDFLDDSSPQVRATALVGLVSANWIEEKQAQAALTAFGRGATEEEKIALARAIYHQAGQSFVEILLQLAESDDREVRREVARSMQAVRSPRFIPALLGMLAHREVRAQARAALLELGDEAVEALGGALRDPDTPVEIRRHLPRTLHRFDPQTASRLLLPRLVADDDGMVRYKILRALGSLRARYPELPLDWRILQEAVERTMSGVFQLLDWRVRLERMRGRLPELHPDVHELMVSTLRHKERHAIERLFRLLGLLNPQEEFDRIYQGLTSPRKNVQSSSRELLEATLHSPLRESVLGLLDGDLDDEDRLEFGEPYYRSDVRDYEDLLARLIERSGTALRCLAVYHAGQLRLRHLESRLIELESSGGRFLPGVAARALELMRSPQMGVQET